MSWLILAIVSYVILAVVNLMDKFLVDNVLPSSKAYAFLVGFMSVLIIIIAPWFLNWPGSHLLLVNLLTGALFPLALLFLYSSLHRGDASKILVLIGGIVPVFSIIFSIIFLQEKFSSNQWLGFVFLLIGTFVMALLPEHHNYWKEHVGIFKRKSFQGPTLLLAILASLFFAAFFVGTKYAYTGQTFWSAFIWIRIGSALMALAFLLPKHWRHEIIRSLTHHSGRSSKSNKWLVLGNQILSSGGFILQNYAVFLGSVAVVSALQGVQYAVLLTLGIVITLFFPKILKEDVSKKIIIQKIAAIICIAVGLYYITI
ncbi:MAG: DMT family transporter [Planctomycetes bacterium]|jgi:drug/metabolite transporter (DMT)-like permease|nr:DMT family transporter [Planctomycetota bacterium]